MKLVACSACNGAVSSEAVACPKCGHPLATPTRAKSSGLLRGVGLAVGGLFVVGAIVGTFSGKAAEESRVHAAQQMCNQFAAERLKAPATADFARAGDRGVSTLRVGRTYEVRSYVDSENGFGAKIRQTFDCKVQPDSGSDTWQLVDLRFERSL